MSRRSSILLLLLWLLASVYVALAVRAGVSNYSPVPFGDMWPGELLFFIAGSSGDHSYWWAQHNEHRIVLSRLLFWVDMALLRGTTAFLQVINYLLALGLWAVLCRMAFCSLREAGRSDLARYLPPLILLLCFSLVQYENFYWAFQSQFFLVYLLPAGAFYCLGRAAGQEGGKWFWGACLLAILSAGTMANGVLAPLVLLLQGVMLRLQPRRLLILAALSIMIPLLYFHGYVSPAGHGSLRILLAHPVDAMSYLLLYLGSPLHQLAGAGPLVTQLLGAFLVLSSVFFLWRVMSRPQSAASQTALLALLLFIGGTGLVTAAGRMMFGQEQALSYRYATPALVAWAALLILYYCRLAASLERRPALLWLLLLLPACFFPAQLQFQHRSHFPDAFTGKLSVLAMQMGVQDQEARDRVALHVPNWMQDFIAKEMTLRSMSVFAYPEVRRAAAPLGSLEPFSHGPACLGYLDGAEPVPGDDRFWRLRGWLADPGLKAVPESLRLLDAHGRVQGHVLIGGDRPDVAKAVAPWARHSGFSGYVLRQEPGTSLTLQGNPLGCQLQLNL